MPWNHLRDHPGWRVTPLVSLLALLCAPTTAAQSGGGATGNPPSRVADPVLTRDANGHVTIRATRITQPISIDGRLDDAAYREVSPFSEFIQQVPNTGAPVSEKTEMWVMFDDTNIYLTCRCWDERPDQIIANDMRRDNAAHSSHDHFGVAFDTFNDERNGFLFYLSAVGAIRDALLADQRANFDWNGVYDYEAGRFDGGWIGEMAFPFKSLRYRPGRDQTWGIQLRRGISRKAESAYVTPLSPARATAAINDMSQAATLIGLEAPPPALNLEVKPYTLVRLTTDNLSQPAVRNDVSPDAGFDVKYGVTKSLTADFTYNTDFAQVEADEAQVNLTRFSLFLPEKREFFLEGQGVFAFGRGFVGGFGDSDVPTLFYSRRIGLSSTRAVPVIGGARLTGRAGPWSIGTLNIQTDNDTASGARETNFTVLALRRNILRRSNFGGLYTRRSASTIAPGDNQLWGLESNLAFYDNVFVSTYVARSRTESLAGDDLSYRTEFNYAGDRYGLALDRLVVEEHFNPEVGLLRRQNFRRNFAQARFSPRTKDPPLVRKWTYQTSLEYTTNNANLLESRALTGEFETEFHNTDILRLSYARQYEFVPAPFTVSRGVHIQVGGYVFDTLSASFTAGETHRVSGRGSFDVGGFYGGNKTTATYRGRIAITPQLGIEPNISLNWVDLPQARFTSTVVGGRTIFTMTPRMFVAGLVQYSSSNTSLSANLRLRWEYRPGSELFVVYSEGRSTLPFHGTDLESRGVAVKINRLVRF